MPELPEVETVRRVIEPHAVGRTITAVAVNPAFPAVLEAPDGVNAAATLAGLDIEGVARRGKYLLFDLSDDWWMIIHLRMTGRLLLADRKAPPVRFEHAALHLDNETDLRFGDQRKFGRIILALPEEIRALSARLGPEPFDRRFTGAWLYAALQRRTGKIKAILLDQHLIAGLGNIYVDEALFRCRIHPETRARDLTQADATRLVKAIRHVLKASLANQGTTFSTFENPYGESGSHAAFLRVYGQGKRGLPCPRCGTMLVHTVVGGRGTTYCPLCQPPPEHAAGEN